MAAIPKDSTSTRAKLGTACYRCRGFRHACDRAKPSCSRCQRRGIICTYPEAAPTLKKLQKATETLGDRIKKFGDLLKTTGEHNHFAKSNNNNKGISLQWLAQSRSTVAPSTEAYASSVLSAESDTVASTSSFSVYPCLKCYKDLQPCDLTVPGCTRCSANGYECIYQKTEPKANHVSQVLNTMNKVMDQWQESIDKMAKDFAQKTRDFGQKVDQSFKKKPIQPFSWKITTTNKGLSVESNVNSFNDLSKLVDQFKKIMHISTPRDELPTAPKVLDETVTIPGYECLDDTSSIHTASTFSFSILNSAHPLTDHKGLVPIEVTQELTDSLVELYCNTPCCNTVRLPIINTTEFLARYHDPEKRPSQLLIYAVCASTARSAFQFHVWNRQQEEYNMGRDISMAYCLKGRELLAEVFDDEPTLDHCVAVFLLAYCHMQNGYTGVLYIYEWIAYNMARGLGLFDEHRQLSQQESMLAWCLYYYNTWYKVFQGDSCSSIQFQPRSPLPPLPPKPNTLECTPQDMVDYYIHTGWHYMIRSQILRQEMTSCLLSAQSSEKSNSVLTANLVALQSKLDAFYDSLTPEWKKLDINSKQTDECPDLYLLAKSCITNVHVDYHINKILLYQAFSPVDHFPTTSTSLQALHTCLNSAHTITIIINNLVSEQDNQCNVPFFGLVFANMVYIKLLSYHDDHPYRELARQSLIQSLDTLKRSKAYIYDIDMSTNLLHVMEQDAMQVL
ncbi:hypothetical protein BCV72DRAFT_30398 [Rhizopus microsporus var. microsporus]|uniref:Zn(2)-C6 fungal-type domain-containing protein n=2 Tax=Rhizopus microsporus TaxID=58291 RepID=A0A2G4TAX7_RHIZD|nr:uncharacterized protein RHIMIDRAFT_12510 [Rhizopus microsporus ATCC 52813]ORE10245.1 hypothetical protein BCV72DRAFT_30398 [Rhizopus microsporus var. microsporus]PHZ17816.1 hypothetical protein RHIMIDRAFT_12510 [Rhizopus microsporus ATCC 52813]